MLPTDTLHHRFATGFRPTDGRSRMGLPFPLKASWPILPIWGCSPNPACARDSLAAEIRRAFHELQRHGLAGTFRIWGERIRYRRDLRRLSVATPHMIDDIGLKLDQALAEADRPFWC